MANKQLARASSEIVQTSQSSLTPSEIALTRELAITGANSKTVLTPTLSDELFRLYASRSPEAIEWVFRTHRERSSFWPSVENLNTLFAEHHRDIRQPKVQADYNAELRGIRDRLKAQGLPYGEAQYLAVWKELAEIAKKKGMDAKPAKKKGRKA